MDFDQLLTRFFSTDDITTLPPERVAVGVAALRLQFGIEKNEDQRFALWCLMFMLGIEPDVEEAFRDEEDRAAAREFMEEVELEIEEDDLLQRVGFKGQVDGNRPIRFGRRLR